MIEVVQVLTDLDLTISKAYISSDGGWFMDGLKPCLFSFVVPLEKRLGFCLLTVSFFKPVFHVNDQLGRKLTDERVIEYIQQV